ncbi:unnamed protein product [Caretta caretta]
MAAELLCRGAAAAWDLSPAESPGRRRRRWADREKEEDPAVLTLTHFSRPPFLSFGSLRPGASCTRLLAVDNPNPEEADVAIDRFPAPSTGFSLERRRFLIQIKHSRSGERIFISITWMPLEEGKVRELVTFIVNGIVKHQAVLLGVAEQPLKKKKSLWDAIKKKNTSEGSVSTRAKQKHSNVKNANKTFRVSKKTDTVRSPLQSCENLDVVGGSMSPSKNSLITLENKLPISPISPVLQEQHDTICTPLSMRRSTTYSVLGTVVNDELLQEIDTCNIKKLHNPNEQIKSSSIHSSPSGLVQAHRSNTHVCAPECTAALHSSLSQRRILSPDSFINDSYQLNVEIVAEQVAPILSPDQFVKDNLAIESVSQVHVSVSPSFLSSSVETCITKKSSSSKWKENEKMQYISVSVEHKFPNDVLNETPIVKSQLLHCTKPEQNHFCFPLCDEDLQIRSCSQREQPKKRPVLSATVIKNKLSAAERKGMETTKPKSKKSLNNMIREDVSIIPRHSKLEILQNLPVIDPISGETKCHKDEIHSCSIGSTLRSRKRKNEVYLEDTKTTATEYVEETETKRIFTSCVDSKIKTTVRPLVSKHISREKLHHRKKAGSLSKTIIKTTKPIDGVAQSQLTFIKPLKTVIPRHPMPFAAKNMFYDERWKEKQQRGFTWWLNFILTPDDFTVKTESSQVNAAALILGAENHHKASVPRAPTKEEMSMRAYTARCRLNKLRRAACRLFTSETMVKAIKRLEFEIETRRLLVRKDRHLWKDIGERQKVLNWLLSYNPLWLRIGLETIYGELIALESNSDIMGLAIFILSRLLWNPDIAAEYRHPSVPHLYRDGHEEALSKFTLKKLLLLVCFLDHAKQSRIIDHDPCLFCKDAEFKNSKDVLLAFSRDFLSGEGDLSRHLGFLGLPVVHVQTPLDEFDFAVTNLAVDLQCGIRLVRTMELLTKNWSLSKKLRVPAISRLQKMHNVDVALHVLKERGIQLKDECGASIESKDIVDRHRERTLALLWKIVFAFQVDVSLNVKQLEEEISFLKNTHNIKTQMATLVSCSYQSKVRKNSSTYSSESYSKNVKLLMDWVNAVCGFNNIKVENFTVSFSDGRVLCYLIHHYHPCYVPLEAISQRTTQTVECTKTGTVALNSSSESDTSLNMLAGTFDQTITTSVVYKELLDNEKRNFQLINTAVSDLGGIPAMIHHSDMSNTIPDEKVVITYLSFLCSRLLDLRKETRAARLIQSVWRKYRLKAELKLHQEKDKAARIIQSAVINFLSHRRIQKKVNAAIFIQKHWRRYLAERKALKLKNAKLEETKSESATVIQTYWRRFCARKRYLQLRYYVILVQARIRMMIAASAYKRLLWATVTIQRHLRASLVAKQDQQRYETLKSSSLVIQSAFRRWRKHKIEQKIKAAIVLQTAFRKRQASKLAKRERAAVVIQSWYRMHKDLKQYLHVRKSVIQIQAWLRCVQAKHVYEEKRACILMIQKYYRAYQLGKIQRKNYLQKRAAVTVLQAAFRGRKARLLYRQIKAVCVVQSLWRMRQEKRRFLLLKQSVVTLQSHVRKYQQLKRYKETKNAVCIIQTRYRAYVASKNAVSSFQKIRLAAIVLQSAYRRMQARKEAHVLRSVVKIQSSYRAYVAQRRFENLKAAAVKIQAFIKMIQARKHYRALREAALYVQRRYRSQKYILQLKEYRKLTIACVSVQAAVRGHLIRKRVQRWREAATLLQAYYRMKRDRQRYLRVYSATVIIQNRYCAYQEQVHQRQKFLKVKKAVVCLQAAYRGYTVRKMLKLQYMASVKIQTAFRAHAARMKYQAMIQASLVIQRWYRAYKTGYKRRYRALILVRWHTQEYLSFRRAVIRIQSLYRGIQTRRNIQHMHLAASTIQSAFRTHKIKISYQRMRMAALVIQNYYRFYVKGKVQRKIYLTIQKSVLIIQAAYRGMKARQELKIMHASATVIQSLYRMHKQHNHYKQLHWAVRVVQQRFRANRAREAEVKNYTKIKKAALCLQSAFRAKKARQLATIIQAAQRIQSVLQMYLDRRRFLKKKTAAVAIQSAFRCHRMKTRYKAIRDSTVAIQRWYRACRMARLQKAEYSAQRQAVIIIQSAYRGTVVRKMAKQKRAARKIQAFLHMAVHRRKFVRLRAAAVTLQSYYLMNKTKLQYMTYRKAAFVLQRHFKSHLAMKHPRGAYLRTRKSIIIIQSRIRGFIEQRKLQKIKQSTVKIQALFRGFKARQLAGKMRAARTIQAWFRRYRARKEYIAVVKATCIIQGYFKTKQQRTWFLKVKASTVTIQRRWRETLTARTILLQFLATKKAAVKIQLGYRRYSTRKQIKKMQQAACLIQAAYRGFKERHKFHQQKAAALVIQKHIRARQKGRLECIKYVQTRKAAIKLQAFLRGWLVRKKILDEKQKKRLLCFSAAAYHHLFAIKIQRAFRIHLVLKHAQMQISSVICIQRWFRARLQQKKSLQDHQKITKIQRMVRRWLKQRNEAATTIQRAVRKFLFYKHRRKLKNGIIKFQALWRGYSWRKKNDTAKTKALRHSLEMANKESKEENKLCNRTAVAIDYLLKYKHLSYILAALKHLEVVTRLSPLCCENMAHSGAIFTIFILIRNCNRSIPCMEVIKYSVQVLLNVSKYERTTQAVYEVENSVDTLLDLLQMYREKAGDKTSEKGGSIFTKTCCLLAILLKDSKRAADIRSTSRAASRIHSLYKLTARKHKMDAERTLSKHKMHTSMSGSFFVPVTPVRTKVVSRIKPDWVLRKDNMQEIVDPLQAIRMPMNCLVKLKHTNHRELNDKRETSAEDKPCGLPLIENGKIAQYYYSFKSYYFPMSKEKKISYTCVAGYTTESGSQDARITCTATGWSPAPKCYQKCRKPLLENGIFSDTKVSYKIWEQLLYRCAPGYQTPGGNAKETVQCLPEGWSSHPSCAKKFESCLVPDLHHGHYSTTQQILKLNETLMYECDEGYHTRGGNTTEKAVCGTYGWSLTPNCTKVLCSLLSEIEHGNFYPRKKSYEEGDVVQFLCQKNYSLNGSDLIQCYDFGWYPEPPVCEDRRNKCPPPPQPPNANILTDLRTYHNGAKVHLACKLNFTMKGSEEIQCENGKWTSPPSCIASEAKEKIPCDQPPPIEKGTPITEDKMYYTGDTVRYSCDHGYSINGSNERTCKMGKWTSPPKCIETLETCSSPPAIKNGASFGPLLTNYTTGSSVKYRCYRYHTLEGPETVHCIQGKWTAQPTCLEPCTLNVDEVSNNNIEMKWRLEGELFFLHGDTIDFVCKQGYYLSASSRPSQLTVQCTRGKLRYPTCIMKDPKEKCGSPPIIKNGDVIDPRLTEYESDSSVEYTCFDYHFLQGSNRVYCSKGQWTTPPDCIEPCTLSKDVMDKNNLILRWSFDDKSYFFHGDYIEFLCKENHYGAPSTSEFDFRVECSRGQLTYPRCVERGR